MTCSRVMWHVANALGLGLALFLTPAWGLSVNLAWNAPTQYTDGSAVTPADIGGYKVHYGTTSHAYTSVVDVGNVTTTTLSGLSDTMPTYVAVTAYAVVTTTSASASGFSAPELVVPPAPPGNGSVQLAWEAPTQYTDGTAVAPADLGGYTVHYGAVGQMYTWVVDVGNVTTTLLTGLSTTVPTTVVVRAYGAPTALTVAPSNFSSPELVVTPTAPAGAAPGTRRVGWFWWR